MQIENRKSLVSAHPRLNLETITFYWTRKVYQRKSSQIHFGEAEGIESIFFYLYLLSVFRRDQLFSNQLYLEIDVNMALSEALANGSLTISVVSYRNLTHFLPKMYFSRNR